MWDGHFRSSRPCNHQYSLAEYTSTKVFISKKRSSKILPSYGRFRSWESLVVTTMSSKNAYHFFIILFILSSNSLGPSQFKWRKLWKFKILKIHDFGFFIMNVAMVEKKTRFSWQWADQKFQKFFQRSRISVKWTIKRL